MYVSDTVLGVQHVTSLRGEEEEEQGGEETEGGKRDIIGAK